MKMFSNRFLFFFVCLCFFCHFGDAEQSQLDDKDRTIRIQQNLINKLEAEVNSGKNGTNTQSEQTIDTVNSATQTDRVSESQSTHFGI